MEGELLLELIMDSRGISYRFGHYPEIREFAALVEQLEPGRIWNGLHFQAGADSAATGAVAYSSEAPS